METKSVHSSHHEPVEEKIIDDEKKAASFYNEEEIVGEKYDNISSYEDSPIEEVKIVVPK